MTAMTTHSYTLTEYDPARPWLILSTSRSSIELPEGDSFDAWAAAQYPSDRYRVQIEREPFRWVTAVQE